ncbi:S8 family serine peptidase [Caminibacter pacificus]
MKKKILLSLAASMIFAMPNFYTDNFIQQKLTNKNILLFNTKTDIKPQYDPNTLIVEYENNPLFILKAKNISGVKSIKVLKNLSNNLKRNIAILQVEKKDIKKVYEELKKDPSVKRVSLNYVRKPLAIPNDPKFMKQWHLDGADNNAKDINVQNVWDRSTGSKDIVVAVFDTGISLYHEDLKDNIWVNEKELNGKPGVDDDGDGYVDDVYGFDFAKDLNGNNGPLTGDIGSHGTHVAGIIGAIGDNGVGVSGVNWNVKILPVKVFRPNLGAYDSDILEAIDYVLKLKDEGVNIVAINASYGGFGGDADNSPMKDAIASLGDKGIVFFAAAGNSGIDNDLIYYDLPALPASYNVDNLVAVAATDENQKLTYFSQYGKKTVQVGAPGINILSTTDFIDGNDTGSQDFDDGFENGLGNWTVQSGNWDTTTAKAHEGKYSLTDSPNGDYDDSSQKVINIYSKTIDLSGEKGKNIALDFCMNDDLAVGDYLLVSFYDKNSGKTYVQYHFTGSTNGEWKCVGIPIEEYYKTDEYRVIFSLYTNGDGRNGDGVYIDDVKIGNYSKTNMYEAWAGTSMATPVVTGTYALLSSLNNEDMMSKISRVIGNGYKVDLPIMGTVDNVENIVNGPTPPFIYGTKKVMSVTGDTATIKVANAGSEPKVYIGDKEAEITKIDGDNITFKVPVDSQNQVTVKNGDVSSSNKLYISKWQMLPKMPTIHTRGVVSGIDNGKLYVLGGGYVGSDGNIYFNPYLDVYDIKNNSWNDPKNVNLGRLFGGGAFINGKFYFVGGVDSDSDDSTYIKMYDPQQDLTADLEDTGKNIYYPMTLAYDNYLVYVGGIDSDKNVLKEAYAFDTEENKIITLPDMNTPRVIGAMCRFGNDVYVFGGLEDANTVSKTAEYYDKKNNKWVKITDMPKALMAANCVNVDNKYIMIFGGMNDDKSLNHDIIKYYPDTGKYEVLSDSIYDNILNRSSLGGNHIAIDDNGDVYFVGGYNSLIQGTKTVEKVSLKAVDDSNETIGDDDGNNDGNDDGSNDSGSGGGSAPLFDFATLLALLGGALLIFRRK